MPYGRKLGGQMLQTNKPLLWLGVGLLSIFLFIALSCKDDEPEFIDAVKPGKRDYVWSIDSVYYGNRPGMIALESIWGSSANDVWGAAPDAGNTYDCLWHYDGIKWTRATDGTPITYPGYDANIYAVWGSAKNNVWAFGRKYFQGRGSAFIMNYNGSGWRDATPSDVADLHGVLFNVSGASANNIWVGGYECVLHFDGQQWKIYTLPDSMIVGSIAISKNAVYLSAYFINNKRYRVLYRILQDSLIGLDTTTFAQEKFENIIWASSTNINSLANGIISTTIKLDGGIDVNGWKRVLTTDFFLSEKCIQSSKNIFAVGQGALVEHYNGEDWRQITITVPNHTLYSNTWFCGVWTDGNEVFICDWLDGVVYHGR